MGGATSMYNVSVPGEEMYCYWKYKKIAENILYCSKLQAGIFNRPEVANFTLI